jgi:hypothetical protein
VAILGKSGIPQHGPEGAEGANRQFPELTMRQVSFKPGTQAADFRYRQKVCLDPILRLTSSGLIGR